MGFLSDVGSFIGDVLDNPIVEIGAQIVGANRSRSANRQAISESSAADEEARRLREEQLRIAQARAIEASKQPVKLGPGSQQQIGEARQSALRGIRASGLSGSGRATSAIVRDVENRVTGPLIENERTRNERLATNLGNLDVSVGEGRADTTRRIGSNVAAGTIANEGLRSDVIGSVLGTISAENKERESRRA